MSLQPLAYALLAALANVLGAAAVTSRARWSMRALDVMVALSAGFMIAVSLGELLPEAIARNGRSAALAALAGYMLVHLTQHTFARHFHFGEETHEVNTAVSASALVGLLLHTFFDGVAIASGFAVSAALRKVSRSPVSSSRRGPVVERRSGRQRRLGSQPFWVCS